MLQQIEIVAELRKDVGKGASRRLRRAAEQVPGIIYGGGDDPAPLVVNGNALAKAMQQESFYSQIINVIVDGKSQQAVVRDLQRNPFNEKVLHIDFMRISADRVIEVSVPLHFVDQDKCVGVKLGGGNIIHNMTEVEISCLPGDLPQYIEVFMAEVGLNEAVHLSDLALPPGVTIVALGHGDDRDDIVVSVQSPRGGSDEDEAAEPGAAGVGGGAAGEPSED